MRAVSREGFASDWATVSDTYGVYVGEFKTILVNSDVVYSRDYFINIEETV